ncbi:hypothetical protein [Flavivirga eckloniae]|uniref:Uncharacterized protein n=1 Tax=Flavivirga eckloniae TaxID=1803846 RepID=A0A2K9PVW1_9FLAO|nr:hypothetical protein [Flavivirga eckloniae]AUP81199.1 hypothetical protein C1H87_21775 [Flavivirga eckloniae]
MKGRKRIESINSLQIDLSAVIDPKLGLGGFNFTQKISDFEIDWTNSFFEKAESCLNYEIDKKYFFLNISTTNREVELNIDLFTGKISSMICKKGYSGTLENGIGIGSNISKAFEIDKSLGFNMDTDWINRTPFDGLIIYVPKNLQMQCFNSASKGESLPDFKIETIELLDMEFAEKMYEDELFFE